MDYEKNYLKHRIKYQVIIEEYKRSFLYNSSIGNSEKEG